MITENVSCSEFTRDSKWSPVTQCVYERKGEIRGVCVCVTRHVRPSCLTDKENKENNPPLPRNLDQSGEHHSGSTTGENLSETNKIFKFTQTIHRTGTGLGVTNSRSSTTA